MAKGEVGPNDLAWAQIFEENPQILREIGQRGIRRIRADEIKRFREPRLMTKFDNSDSRPKPFKEHSINVLPVSRYEYVLGDFDLYAPLPPADESLPTVHTIPDLETLRLEDISSESNAINALNISGILKSFLGEEDLIETFNGRMGTGSFDFRVSRPAGNPHRIHVDRAQLEIDGGFESPNSVVILEAKNVPLEDFNVRQLYYPFRKFHGLVKKPLRLVFSQYTNLTYRLFEYSFGDPSDYSSLTLVKTGLYSIDSSVVSWNDVVSTIKGSRADIDDSKTNIPFPQADTFERIIALCELLNGELDGMRTDRVAEVLEVVHRQAAYYPAAGEYLGLIDRREHGIIRITCLGNKMVSSGHRERTLLVLRAMLRHESFKRTLELTLEAGRIPSQLEIADIMWSLQALLPSGKSYVTYKRRAQTVKAWVIWLCRQVPDCPITISR